MDLHILFVDYRMTFDSVDRQALIEDVTNLKIPGQLIELTKMTMEMSKPS